MTREQLPEFKRIGVVGQPCDGRSVPQRGKNPGRENIADVLEEIWRIRDREVFMANLGRWPGLLRKVRAMLLRIKDDALGTCLCCRTGIGLRRRRAVPWAALCISCEQAADRNDADVLRIRSRGCRQGCSRPSLRSTERFGVGEVES